MLPMVPLWEINERIYVKSIMEYLAFCKCFMDVCLVVLITLLNSVLPGNFSRTWRAKSSVTQSCLQSQKHLHSFPSSSVTGRNCLGGMHKCLIPKYIFIYGILKVGSQSITENETFLIVRHDGTYLSTQPLRDWSRRIMNLRAVCVT